MNRTEGRIDNSALVGGLILIGIGALFLFDTLDLADFSHLMRCHWPLIVVLVGLPKLFRADTVFAGLWLIAVGLWMQAVVLHLYGLTWGNSWPLLLMVAGSGIILRTFFEAVMRRRDSAGVEGERDER